MRMRRRAYNIEKMQQQQQKPSQRHRKYVKNILLLSLLLLWLGTSEAGVIKKRETHNDPDIVTTTIATTEATRAPLKLSALESESVRFQNATNLSEDVEKVTDKSKESIGKLVLSRVETNSVAATTEVAITEPSQSINDDLDEFQPTTVAKLSSASTTTTTTTESILDAIEQIATVNQTSTVVAIKNDNENDNVLPATISTTTPARSSDYARAMTTTQKQQQNEESTRSAMMLHAFVMSTMTEQSQEKQSGEAILNEDSEEERTQVEPTLGTPVPTTSPTTKIEGASDGNKSTTTTVDIAKSSHENAIVDESHESKEEDESIRQEKRPKFISDNSTNAQHMNLPNGVEVWTLASMKLVPESNSEPIAKVTTTHSTEMGNEIEQLQRQQPLEKLSQSPTVVKDKARDESESHTEFLLNSTLDATESNKMTSTQLNINIGEISTTTKTKLPSDFMPDQSIETTSTERIALSDKNDTASKVDLSTDKGDNIAVITATTTTETIKNTAPIQSNDQSSNETTAASPTEQNQLENEQRTEPNSNKQKTAVSASTPMPTVTPTETETSTAEKKNVSALNVHDGTHTTANAPKESEKTADSEDDDDSVVVKPVRQNANNAEHKVDNETVAVAVVDADADAKANVAVTEKTLAAVNDEQISSTAVSQQTAGEESTSSIKTTTITATNAEFDSVGERGTTTTIRTLPIIETITTTTTTTEASQISNEVNLEAGEKTNLKNNKNDDDKATETLKNDADNSNKPTSKPTALTNNTTVSSTDVEPNELIISATATTTSTTEKSYTTSDDVTTTQTAAVATSTLATSDTNTNGSRATQVVEIEIITTTTTTTTETPVVNGITDVKVSEPHQQQEKTNAKEKVHETHESPLETNNIGETTLEQQQQEQQQVAPNTPIATTITPANIANEDTITIRTTPTPKEIGTQTAEDNKPNKLHETQPNTLPEVDDNSAFNKDDYDDEEDILLPKITTTSDTTTSATTTKINSMATLKATETEQNITTTTTTTTDVPLISLLDDTTTTTTTTTTPTTTTITPKSIATKVEDIYKVIITTSTESTISEVDTMLPKLNVETTTSGTLQLSGIGINIDPTKHYNPHMPMEVDNLQTKSTDAGDETDVNVIIAITVSVIGVVALILLVAFLYLMRKRQKQTSYGQRCRPVSLDAYSLDNVSVLGSVRRKSALRASKRSYGNAAFDDPALRHNVLNATELGKYVERKSSIFEEFRDVPQIIARADEVPAGCEDKNRYANVIPLPETRVVLQQLNGDDKTEYINANYVRGPKDAPNYYIACQAPMETTVADFWRMIWEQQSRVIIQATDLNENGIEKCAEYLPPSVTLDNHTTYGDFQVTLKNREIKDKYAISTILLKHTVDNASRELTHYWYKWPEAGVPNEEAPIIAMLLEARSSLKSYAIEQANELKEKSSTLTLKSMESSDGIENNGSTATEVDEKKAGSSSTEINGNITSDRLKAAARNQGPLTIHCSPGTGRTGTIIACDMAIRNLETPKRAVDIPQIVYYVRRGRASAVQTKEQYEFIYKVANMYATKITNLSSDA